MSEPSIELISSGHGLLEGPVWHPTLGLLVADVDFGGVWGISAGNRPKVHVSHRRGIGGIALHESGGLVVSGRNVAFKPLEGEDAQPTQTIVLLEKDPERGVVGYNDLTTDSEGRIYVGSLGFKAMEHEDASARSGFLHMIDLDGSHRVVAEDVQLTNGLGWSSDGKRLYHSDSLRHIVKVYELRDDGSLSLPKQFATTPFGHPDGLAVAEDDSVWVAVADGHSVCRFSADGRELQRIPFPVPMITSLCFGGDDLRDLYVVTGSRGAPSALGGCVYKLRVDVAGLPRALARVPLSTL